MPADIGTLILKLIIILASVKFTGIISEKLKQPRVLGELIAGIILGPSIFGLINPGSEPVLTFLAEIGIIVLLFEVGLESNLYKILKAGLASTSVALIGIIVPFFLGYIYAYSAGLDNLVAIFIGAALTTTSVAVTINIFSEFNKIQSEEAKVILGAAIIDDVLGLIILSVLIGIIATGSVALFSIGKTLLLVILFLILTLTIGIKIVPLIIRIIHALEIKRTFLISDFLFALLLAFLANLIGLATIIGAFAAGLVLAASRSKDRFIERIKPVSNLFTPIFFVMAGSFLNIWTLFEGDILRFVLALTAIAIIGKLVSGFGVIKNKANKLVVGLGMVPRGEVGLIFASIGLTSGLLDNSVFSILVIVIMISTLIVPPILKIYMK